MGRAYAPGRVNLIGDHTDYSGGLVLPMAIDLGTTVELIRGGDSVTLVSDGLESEAVVPLDVGAPASVEPPWARYVAGVLAAMKPTVGGHGSVSTTLPIGAGLSSSAALEVALALALGFEGTALSLAQACQQAEHLASGVPSGLMDQLASVCGVAGHALMIDCATLTITPVAMPDEVTVVVVHSGGARSLAATAYAERRTQVEEAAAALGRSLRSATVADVCDLGDPLVRRRARHIVTENERVTSFVSALASADLAEAGWLMGESHASLRDDFEVSTAALDSLVKALSVSPGVFGARLTGGGFGGCAVALVETERASELTGRFDQAWVVHAADGALSEP